MIVDILNNHSKKNKNKKAFIFIDENENEIDSLSYIELQDQAKNIAAYLKQTCNSGDRVLLLFQPGLDYIKALFACFIAGVIAVPLYPPRRNKKADRIIRVAESCDYSLILCGEQDKETIVGNFYDSSANDAACNELDEKAKAINLHTIESIKKNIIFDDKFNLASPGDVAFLQYTSGSTGVPKGVTINHENIIGNVSALTTAVKSHKDDVFVNWLPLFHDLGLITAVLWPVYLGATSVLMSPANFIRRPILWLNAITKYRGTLCGAPNFAFQLCCEKINDEELPRLDLSSWRVAYNAAEPVQNDTIQSFQQKFAAAKLMPTALLTSYGMAEATAFITCSEVEDTVSTFNVDAELLSKNQIAVCDDNKKSQILIGCGKAIKPHDIRVVDPVTLQELPDDEVGEVWFSGPSVSTGYWELPEITQSTFSQSLPNRGDAYMRTGDFGLMHKGEIYITGRMKDIIIIEGRNYYPQDIEWHTEKYNDEVAAGACAAFSYPGNDGEKLIVVAEIARSAARNSNLNQVIKNIRQKIISEFFIHASSVILLKPLSMPKTSSGKIQRKLTKSLLAENKLNILLHSDDMPEVDYVAPSNDGEMKLCLLIGRILGREKISIEDNFFDIGGKSLTAIELISGIKEQFAGVEVSFEQLFSAPTIKDLALYIEQRKKLEALHNQVVIKEAESEVFEI